MISVIVAAYNCEKYIEKALQSVFSQTLPENNYEIIVVNDGSTDNTSEILDRYADRIKLITQENKGLIASCNRAIGKASGDFLIRLDADDYFDKELLSASLKILKTNPEFYCTYTDRYEVDELTGKQSTISVGQKNLFDMVACGIMFRKEVFETIGLYENLLFEEYDLMLRFFKKGFNAYYIQKPLYYYVRHKSNMTQQKDYWKNGWKQLADKWGEKELKRWVDIQIKENGESRFSGYIG
ncbi:MAG: glycosyltransferase family A protein [Candidatus Methanoperedens sp.]|nr:glycosyltransferase family A protein [Candidatus Methanoperedens sp.]